VIIRNICNNYLLFNIKNFFLLINKMIIKEFMIRDQKSINI